MKRARALIIFLLGVLGILSLLHHRGRNVSLVRTVSAAGSTAQLTVSDVQRIIAQAVTQATRMKSGKGTVKVTVAVVDHEGNILGVFRMTGAKTTVILRGGGKINQGLEGAGSKKFSITIPAHFAAISKAGTAAFFSTQGNAFTTRTASFIVQQHFPPGIDFTAGGPLFGVQFSQLPCSDVLVPPPVSGVRPLPLGLAGDPGSAPLYKDGVAVGGIGVEGDGIYGVVSDPNDTSVPFEELIALAGSRGFEAPAEIHGDQILADGIRLPYLNATMPPKAPAIPFASLPGTIQIPVSAQPSSAFIPVGLGGMQGESDSRYFPAKPGTFLTAAEVERILTQAAAQAFRTRAAIRQPLGSFAQVNISVVDVNGSVLGFFRTPDAPVFGFDVSAQKGRTANFFSGANAGSDLIAAGHGFFVNNARNEGLALDGSIAFSDRAGGFLSRPFFPDGINGTVNGPFSRPIGDWSIFNDGLQVELVKEALATILDGGSPLSCTSTALLPGGISRLPNGIQIFAGSVPLYKNGRLVGAIGVSGDGIDQDDVIATMGSAGFEAPPEIRADQVFVRGVRLPFVKFPRHPDL